MDIKYCERPSLTTDMVLFRIGKEESDNKRKKDKLNLEVLLVKREQEPQKDYLSLPGGFVNIDEDIECNVLRKLKEKTGLYGTFYMEQLYTKGELYRDPRGRVVSVSYLGLCDEDTLMGTIRGGTSWYCVSELITENSNKLAFDHKEIITYALNRLKNKLEYTDIAFNLMKDKFILSDLQEVYEIILNKEILNFRRKIRDYIMPAGEMSTGNQFRPAEVFKLNKNRNKYKF